MSFNSALFLVFFPIVVSVFFLTPHRFRWVVLLLASSYFYMCFVPVYILILYGIILVDYVAGIFIEKSAGSSKKVFLGLSIAGNLGALLIFKYFNFFTSIIRASAHSLGLSFIAPVLGTILPIGLSFHTLQSLSYTIDVYKGTQKAERHLGIFAVYVLFFPQLVAGPIERPQHMLHQFREPHHFEWAKLVSGLQWMTWGFFMKVVIADRLALFVKPVFDIPSVFAGPSYVVATIFFAFQIYCDFAGYSCIAIGAAKTMGFDLMQNFDRPYISKSISEFWRRWHISLSSWLRDYVYIPLGGNKVPGWKVGRNIAITFILSGLWHGAAWTYVLWGALNAIYIISSGYFNTTTETRTKNPPEPSGLRNWYLIVSTFFLTCVGWVLFRAKSVADALYILGGLPTGWGLLVGYKKIPEFWHKQIFMTLPKSEFVIAVGAIVFLLVAEWWIARQRKSSVPVLPARFKTLAWVALICAIFLFGEFHPQTFIYFQF